MRKRKKGKEKNHIVVCRLDDEEYIIFKEKQVMTGLTQQDFILKSIMNKPVRKLDELRDYTTQLSKIGGNLNQIAFKLNRGDEADDRLGSSLFMIQLELEETWQSLRQYLQDQV